MKRFFAFGCSYTLYSWPTWADMLGTEYDEFYNWGYAGLGNRAIAERVAEAHAKHNFTKDDLVIVQWSTHIRHDWWHRYSKPERSPDGIGWKTSGSVFNEINQELYDQKWVSTFFYEPAYFMHTLNNIMLVQHMLESIGCTWYMTSMGDVRNLGADLRDHSLYGEKGNLVNPFDKNVDKVAWKKIPNLEIYDDKIWGTFTDHWVKPLELFCQQYPDYTYSYYSVNSRTKQAGWEVDLHPSPRQHYLWLKEELSEKISIDKDTLALSEEIADHVDVHYQKNKGNKAKFSLDFHNPGFFPEKFKKLQWVAKRNGF